jgi:L-2-hydroxyglutarate oxidase LhgO
LEAVDAVVVGAGVVGLAVARALARNGREVLVLERETAIGQGISSRNSEVIHAGLYYPAGSLKGRLCVAGKQALYAYAAERGVAHRPCGKLVVATDPGQLSALAALAERARGFGVPVQTLAAPEAQALEPALSCVAALWSPTTGIIDSHGLMLALQADLEHAGGLVALASAVHSLTPHCAGWVLQVQSPDGATELNARTVVNAAGLWACDVAQRTVGLAAIHQPRARFAKGHYFALAGRAPFARLVYPMHNAAGLGVHITLDLGGQAKFGPDVQWLDLDDPAHIDYAVDERRADSFYAEIRRYWPALPDGALQPAYSGVRPKIVGPTEPAADFRIDGPAQHGLPGLVNLLGIESPGLTASLAIGEHVAHVLA